MKIGGRAKNRTKPRDPRQRAMHLLGFRALPLGNHRLAGLRCAPRCNRALPPSSYDDPWPAPRVSARRAAKSGKISMPPLTSRSSHDFFAGGFASKDHRVLIGALVRCSRRAIRKLSNGSQTSRFRHIHKNNMALTPYGTCHAASWARAGDLFT